MKTQTVILSLAAILSFGGGYWLYETKMHSHATTDEHGHAEGKEENHADEEREEGHHDEQTTTITPDAAKAAGIGLETAGPVALSERLPLRGKIILNPETTAEVKARFPGVVKSVRKAVGETVAKGETLATVESNDSLQTYAVASPLAGVILGRHAHVGDTADEQPLFVIANLATVTAELHVFQTDLTRIQPGQQVVVESLDGAITGTGKVKVLLPATDTETQSVATWVTLDNPTNQWRSGMAVQAGAVVSEEQVPLAVKNTALQTLEDKTVVFVKEGDAFRAHPVKLGRSDGIYTEVLEGLDPSSTYVARNSFVIKADIGKSAAGHAH